MIGFTKMHGCGNDYVYVDCINGPAVKDPSALSVKISDRHKGVGGDGLVLICPSDKADAFMRMFNADGSEGRMCGNAIRCVGKYLYDSGIAKKENISVETLSGIKYLEMKIEGGSAAGATVDMGAAGFDCKTIPAVYDGECIGKTVRVAGGEYEVSLVSMGSPHCVVFCDDPDSLELEKIGPCFEHDPLFPEGVNTEFVKKTGDNSLRMRVWERGSGETFACGTGACAAVSASVRLGYSKEDEPVTVSMRGGELVIRYTEKTVYMTGEAVTVSKGIYFGDTE
ncbi:MAG: diaminopimelate epimerase [Clostridia bacterium]|nr:diaminopimelate epimerase [Clostridia bacterium]